MTIVYRQSQQAEGQIAGSGSETGSTAAAHGATARGAIADHLSMHRSHAFEGAAAAGAEADAAGAAEELAAGAALPEAEESDDEAALADEPESDAAAGAADSPPSPAPAAGGLADE